MNKIIKCLLFIFLMLFVSFQTSCKVVDDTNDNDQQQEENENNNQNDNQNDNQQDVDGLPWV